MKNILYVHSSAEKYGSDRSLFNIVSGIDKKKYKAYVVLPCDGPLVGLLNTVPEVETFVINDLAVLRRKSLTPKGMIRYLLDYFNSKKKIISIIKNNGIDLVITNTSVVFPGAIAAKKNGVRSIWHAREIISNPLENALISYVMNKYSDVVIANSKATANAFIIDESKKKVVYNGIVMRPYDMGKRSHPHVPFMIGMAGRINRWKGQGLFVEAASEVLSRGIQAKFLIAGAAYAGDENLVSELESKIEELNLENQVKLLGQVEDMSEFYDSIDLFVVPSVQPEPFGLVVVEAMSKGLPVVATNHGGPAEIIKDGISGKLVSWTSPNEMADAIVSLIKDSEMRESMARNGISRAHEQFSTQAMIKKLEEIYDEQ